MGKVLIQAQKEGCRFDGWEEHFSFERWMEVFESCGIDPNFYTSRKREYDEVLPWDHIDVGVNKKYLINEAEKADAGEITKDCRINCSGCGVQTLVGGICVEQNKN